MELLIFSALFALVLSFLCSLLEASLLSVSDTHLAMLSNKGSSFAQSLRKMKGKVDRPLAAILTLNTIAHTVGAAGVGAQAAIIFGQAAVGVASAIMTILILVLSEVVPKTIGATYAKSLVGFTAVATGILIFITYPAVIVLEWVNGLLGENKRAERLSRGELVAAIQLGRHSGTLSRREYRILKSLLSLRKLPIWEILTPRTVVESMRDDQTVSDLVQRRREVLHTRIPIHKGSLDETVGYVVCSEILDAHEKGQGDNPLSNYLRPLSAVPESVSVSEALDAMLKEKQHIMIAIDEHGGVAGIITLEDCIEALLGAEIVDETDTVTDLRELAQELAAKKLGDGE